MSKRQAVAYRAFVFSLGIEDREQLGPDTFGPVLAASLIAPVLGAGHGITTASVSSLVYLHKLMAVSNRHHRRKTSVDEESSGVLTGLGRLSGSRLNRKISGRTLEFETAKLSPFLSLIAMRSNTTGTRVLNYLYEFPKGTLL